MQISDTFQHPSDDADLMTCELASEMLTFISQQYRSASDDVKRLQLTLEYGPVIAMLSRVLQKAWRHRRGYPGNVERKRV